MSKRIVLKQCAFLFQTTLEEKLTRSELIANRNNEAANSTSEQLLKANQIISKQNADIIEMKEKVLSYFLYCLLKIFMLCTCPCEY